MLSCSRMERMEKEWLSKTNAVDLSLVKMKVEDEVATTPWMDSMAEEYIVHAWAGNRRKLPTEVVTA